MHDLDPIVESALEVLTPPSARDPDWYDVLTRARENGHAPAALVLPVSARGERKRNSSRRVALALAAALVLFGLLVATSAFGLRDKLVHLFSAEQPAPSRVILNFELLDRGAPSGLGPGVVADDARRVLTRSLSSGLTAVLYAAPTANDGFCVQLEFRDRRSTAREGPTDCSLASNRSEGVRAEVVSTGSDSFLLYGSLRAPEATGVEIGLADGRVVTPPVTFVGPPVNAGFFLLDAPKTSLPTEVRALRADGTEIGTARLAKPPSTGFVGWCRTTPCNADPTTIRRLTSLRTSNGVLVTAFIAETRDGARCIWASWTVPTASSFSACPAGTRAALALGLAAVGVQPDAALVLLGPVDRTVVLRIEVESQGRTIAATTPTAGYALVELPAITGRPRSIVVRGLSSSGKVVASQLIELPGRH